MEEQCPLTWKQMIIPHQASRTYVEKKITARPVLQCIVHSQCKNVPLTTIGCQFQLLAIGGKVLASYHQPNPQQITVELFWIRNTLGGIEWSRPLEGTTALNINTEEPGV